MIHLVSVRLKITEKILLIFASLAENLSAIFYFNAKIINMKKPITFYPEADIKEKLESKLEETGMDKDEYLSYLIEMDSEEIEDEVDETLSGVDTLGNIEDITTNNDLINSLEERSQELEGKLAAYEDDKALNQLFEVLDGHTLKIIEDGRDYKIKSKADFVKCLIHSYYVSFDPTEFGLEEEEFFGEDEEQ